MTAAQFHRISKVLADRRRYEILTCIAGREELACSEARRKVSIAPATLSHHVKELVNAGLVEVRRDGRFAHMRLRRKVWREYLTRLREL